MMRYNKWRSDYRSLSISDSAISYIVSEGKIDAEAVTLTAEFVQQVIASVEAAKEKDKEEGEEETSLT